MSLGIFKKAFSTVQIDNLKSYFSSIFAPLPNYKVYRALATQSGTSAPTMTILENTFEAKYGRIVWTFVDKGIYYGTLTGVFTTSKLFLLNPSGSGSFILRSTSFDSIGTYSINRKSDNILELRSYNSTLNQLDNSILNNAPIEIIVYN